MPVDLTDIALGILDMPVEDIWPTFVFPRLRERMARIHPDLSLDTLSSYLHHAKSRFAFTVSGLLDHLTSMERLNVFLGDGKVALRPHHMAYWRRLTQHVDPDMLITKVLARNNVSTSQLADFIDYWGFYPCIEDRFLEPIFRDGLVDIHIHLNGAFPVPLLWLDLMHGHERPEALQIFTGWPLADGDGHRLLPSDIRQAITLRQRLINQLQLRQSWNEFLVLIGKSRLDPRLIRLWEERLLLLHCWHAGPPRDFVAYMQIKNRFNKMLIMSPGHNPGLSSFRRYFDAPGIRVLSPTHGRQRDQLEKCLLLATDSHRLRHVELRISPMQHMCEYRRLLQSVSNVMDITTTPGNKKTQVHTQQHESFSDVKRKAATAPRITFVIHFIRKESDDVFRAMETPAAGLHVDYGRLFQRQMTRTARLSAVLHRFRHKSPELARMITGIDVANKELNTFSHFYTPWLRLLRGYECLDDDPALWRRLADRPGMKYWISLRNEGLLMPPRQLPKLGLTYHVGEEFYHPLEGLMQMEAVIHGARLQPGDRIGHGLAAGWSIDRFQIHRQEILMPAGTLLDLLAWLHVRLSRTHSPQRALLHDIDNEIVSLSGHLYGSSLPARTVYYIWRQRHELLPPQNETGALILRMETDRRLQERSLDLKSYPAYLRQAVGEMENLTKLWWEEMIERRGIIVESNPSSNLAAGGARLPESLPGVRIAARNGGIGIALGTDDPGVFATNIEQEYALFFQGLLDLGISRHTATEIIRHVSHNSRAAVFE